VNVEFAKVPVEPVLVVPLNVTGIPLNVAVKVELAAKPEPDTVTVEPTGPLLPLVIVIDGVKVKVAEADVEFASVTLIM
jgi:hypothetical protein